MLGIQSHCFETDTLPLGGPAGSALAAKLANSKGKPSVLLLEAGEEKTDRNLRVDGQRWITFQNQSMNWGYKTTPQEDCNNREIDYSRGRCMGGSSAINFGVYSVGARDDYQEWARIVDDEDFAWPSIQRRLKDLETFHGEIPEGMDKKYANPDANDHGSDGPLHVGFAREWERDLPELLDIYEKAGFPLNPDHNSGNPIGMSVLINSAHQGLRSTAGDLVVGGEKNNLTIVTNSPVQRVLLEGKKAIGVEANGKKCEYILSSSNVAYFKSHAMCSQGFVYRLRHQGNHSFCWLPERPSYPDAFRNRPRGPTQTI